MIKNLSYLYQRQRIRMKMKKNFYKYKEYIIFLNKFYIKIIFLIYHHEIYNFCLHYKKKK